MQRQPEIRRASGAKAISIDERAKLARYRLLQLTALLLSAAFALSLHFVVGR